MHKEIRFSTHDQILRIVVLAFLLALGYVLMLLGQFLPYPFLPFLQLEPSDLVVLVAYSLYGFFASAFIAIGKTVLQMLTVGVASYGSPIPVGAISAIIASLLYSFGLLILDKVFKGFSKGLLRRIISYLALIIFVSLIMTLLNYLFITPTYLVFGAQFLTVFDVKKMIESNSSNDIKDSFNSFFSNYGNNSYAAIIFFVYFPFNMLKGAIVTFFYELVFNKVIYSVLKTGRIKSKMFLKKDDVHLYNYDRKNILTSSLLYDVIYIYDVLNGTKDDIVISTLSEEEFILKYMKEHDLKESEIIFLREENLTYKSLNISKKEFIDKYDSKEVVKKYFVIKK